MSQLSTIAPTVIDAQLRQEATVGTDYGSPGIFQDTTFAVEFMVPFATTVRLDGSVLSEPGPSDNWARITLARGAVTVFNTDWPHIFPYVVELEPFTTYRLAVDVYGGILIEESTLTSADATLTVVADSDGDGLLDTSDNCTLVPNADQRDTNGDGYGNVCDPNLDSDGTVNFVDAGLMKAAFFSVDPDADLDGSGSVNFIDLGVLKGWFFLPPGPSGLVQ